MFARAEGVLGGGYRVFEVVAYRVYGEAAGFFKEFGGGGGNVEESSAEDGCCLG